MKRLIYPIMSSKDIGDFKYLYKHTKDGLCFQEKNNSGLRLLNKPTKNTDRESFYFLENLDLLLMQNRAQKLDVFIKENNGFKFFSLPSSITNSDSDNELKPSESVHVISDNMVVRKILPNQNKQEQITTFNKVHCGLQWAETVVSGYYEQMNPQDKQQLSSDIEKMGIELEDLSYNKYEIYQITREDNDSGLNVSVKLFASILDSDFSEESRFPSFEIVHKADSIPFGIAILDSLGHLRIWEIGSNDPTFQLKVDDMDESSTPYMKETPISKLLIIAKSGIIYIYNHNETDNTYDQLYIIKEDEIFSEGQSVISITEQELGKVVISFSNNKILSININNLPN